MVPYSVLIAEAIILALLGPAFLYVLFCIWIYRASHRLRTPPDGYESYLREAVNSGMRTLPLDLEENKKRIFRRFLILASKKPSNYSSNAPGLTLQDVPKKAPFRFKFSKEGEIVDRKVIFGFFHPYASAGGGGERVLWAAVRQTLDNHPHNVCAIYIGAENSGLIETPRAIVEKVKARFGIEVEFERVVFIYLRKRRLVDPSTWPRFTLLGQAIGSAMLAYEALNQLVPDVMVDTMGLPFAYPIFSWLAQVPIAAYVHYPVVSSDMLKKIPKTSFKQIYWRLLMWAYGYVLGKYCPMMMTNSTWTNNHIRSLVKPFFARPDLVTIVYPPCAVQDFAPPTEDQVRKPTIVYIAQFRPEKRHELLLREFAKFVKGYEVPVGAPKPHLLLIGSVRNDDDKQRVYSLRLLSRELELGDDYVTFMLDAPWAQVSPFLRSSSIGVNAMWNEHFGMVVVEYMAAGLIPVAHNSAGPKMDIVTPEDNRPGLLYVSSDDPDYDPNRDHKALSMSDCFSQIMAMSPEQSFEKRLAAYEAAQRFSDEVFAKAWDIRVNALIKLDKLKRRKRMLSRLFD